MCRFPLGGGGGGERSESPPNGDHGRLFGHMLMRKTQRHDEPHMWPQTKQWKCTAKQIFYVTFESPLKCLIIVARQHDAALPPQY